MALTTHARGIPQNLREAYPPIDDEAFSKVISDLLARLDKSPPHDPAIHEFTRRGLSREACMIFAQKIAIAAAIDGVTISQRSSFVAGGLIDMTMNLLGEKKVIKRLIPLIRRNQWPLDAKATRLRPAKAVSS